MVPEIPTADQLWSRRQLTLCGSFGHGNTGDEAVMLSCQDLAKASGVPLDFTALSRFPLTSMPEVVSTGDEDRNRRELLRGQPLLMAGGGIIEAGSFSTLWRCKQFLPPFSSAAGLFAANVDASPRVDFLRRERMKRLLARLSLFAVRDALSAEVLGSIVPSAQVEVVGDSVLWLEPTLDLPAEARELERYIAVSLTPRWAGNSSWYSWIGRQLSDLARQFDATLLFVPLSVTHDDDRPEHERVREAMVEAAPGISERIAVIDRYLTPREVARTLAGAELAVSMRLHGCVMAYGCQTPFLGIAYHSKMRGFLESVGWEEFMLPRRLPNKQSRGFYGFDFSSMDWSGIDLASLGRDAVVYSDFSRLEPIKQRLQQTFLQFLAVDTASR